MERKLKIIENGKNCDGKSELNGLEGQTCQDEEDHSE